MKRRTITNHITLKEAAAMLKMRKDGYVFQDIAAKFDVSAGWASKLCHDEVPRFKGLATKVLGDEVKKRPYNTKPATPAVPVARRIAAVRRYLERKRSK